MKQLLTFLAIVAVTLTAQAGPVDDLIPKLAAEDVGSRYAVQMELQAIASKASTPGHEADRAALGAVLAAKAADASVPQPARIWIVRQLEYMGRGEAVAALTALLTDKDAELRECARRALEKNSDPQATASLRAALRGGMGILPMSSGSPILGQDAQATWKIGLIRSLAEKRDADSVALIAPLLTDEKLGRAAAKALGKIASPAAVEALWGVFATQPYASESLVCAANHNPALTTAIAQKLYTQSKDSGTRTAAITLLAPSVPSDAFSSADLRIQKAAIDAAPVATVTEMLPKLSPAGKVFALRRIDSEKAALECAADKDETVRVAALEAFARIGTAYSVPVLLKAAATGTDAEKSAAAASLARVNGTGAGEAIERQAGQGDSATRVLAINAMTARAAKSSLPVLLQYCADPDANVSRAALQAVSKLGGDESLDNLVKFVLSGKPGAKEALQTVANRSTNKTGVGQKLAAQAANATGPQLTAILDVMSLVGGESALQEVVKFTGSTNEEIKDGAIRALCQWRDWPAVKPLLTVIAAPGVKQVHQVLSIQAVCRLVKSEEYESSQARVDAALAALNAASRPQEKTQALSALAAIKDRKAADAIIKLLADPALKVEAGQAALNLAKAIGKSDHGTSRKLAEAVKKANISPALTRQAEGISKPK